MHLKNIQPTKLQSQITVQRGKKTFLLVSTPPPLNVIHASDTQQTRVVPSPPGPTLHTYIPLPGPLLLYTSILIRVRTTYACFLATLGDRRGSVGCLALTAFSDWKDRHTQTDEHTHTRTHAHTDTHTRHNVTNKCISARTHIHTACVHTHTYTHSREFLAIRDRNLVDNLPIA